MFQTWGGKTPEAAAETLLQEDVVVTNQKDKQQQIEKLRDLAANARDIYARSLTPSPQEIDVEMVSLSRS